MKDRGNAITLLFKGGRLASWHQLSPVQRQAYEQEHVDLMLATAQKHQLQRMEGFRLMAPSGDYERFWVIDFPDLAGAEAWIEAEMAPPYGQYGYYEYHWELQKPWDMNSQQHTKRRGARECKTLLTQDF